MSAHQLTAVGHFHYGNSDDGQHAAGSDITELGRRLASFDK